MMYSKLKRILDFFVSFFLLLFLTPIFLLIAILIKIDSNGPIFFIQERVGKNQCRFNLYKFRSMVHTKRKVSKIIGKGDGVTKAGYFLRRFKIDELPQLVNVLIGNMSIIGPRPGVPSDLTNMSGKEKKRYSVRPGLTGLSQVSGNIYLSWQQRYQFDLIYISKQSLWLDLKILTRTIMVIIKGEKKYLNKPLLQQ